MLITPSKPLRLCTVVGARPQFIKAAALNRVIQSEPLIQESLLHTGQHYSPMMSDIFFKELGMTSPTVNFDVGSGPHGQQTGIMLTRIEEYLIKNPCDVMLVFGDTNSTLAGALAAAKLQIPVCHVEAGLRAFTRFKPEEINRVLTDHCSDILFTPTEDAALQLRKEGLGYKHIEVVGDIMYDVAKASVVLAHQQQSKLKEIGVESKEYAICSLHRAENTDDPERLSVLISLLNDIASILPVVIPLHPRTETRMQSFGLTLSPKVIQIDPVGYIEMTMLEQNARIMLTDSGGMQKEAYFHSTPCVTLRDETEWRELLATGWNTLCPISSVPQMKKTVESVLNFDFSNHPQPKLYGDGNTAQKIITSLIHKAQNDNLVPVYQKE